MRTFSTAHKAAMFYAEEEPDNCLEYADRLIDEGIIRFDTDEHGRITQYYLLTDDMWSVFDKHTKEKKEGPFDTKKNALKYTSNDTSSYIDAGIYETENYIIARRGVARERGYAVE